MKLVTARLELVLLDPAARDAWFDGDAARLEALTGARTTGKGDVPALFSDHAAQVRSMPGLGPWLFVLRDTREPVGAGGVAEPDDKGAAMIGYAVLPRHEKKGYATEAARALCDWALDRAGTKTIVGTVPPGNAGSVRVLEKLGFHATGRTMDDEVGEVLVFERFGA